VLIGLAVLAGGWLLSMFLTVVTKYNFTLTRDGPRFMRRFGLFTQHESSFPAKRVQMLRIESPFFQRRLGLCRILVDTAGSFEDDRGGNASTPEVAPIIRLKNAGPICREIVPTLTIEDVQWKRVSKKTISRGTVRMSILLAIIVSAFAFSWKPAWWGMIGVLPVAVTFAYLRWRALGYALAGEFVAVRSGIFKRVHRFIPRNKVQASFVTQGPMQRWLGLSNFSILTAGTMLRNEATVPDVLSHEALALQQQLHAKPSSVPAISVEPAVPQYDSTESPTMP
jgi:putative membrane protein